MIPINLRVPGRVILFEPGDILPNWAAEYPTALTVIAVGVIPPEEQDDGRIQNTEPILKPDRADGRAASQGVIWIPGIGD